MPDPHPRPAPGTVANLTELIPLVSAAPARCGEVRVICIDGHAGSGKTTLAGRLGVALDAPVVHLDDLYEGWSQELGPALAARLDAWLLTPWAAGLAGNYLHFDWGVTRFTKWVSVPAQPVIILEGCGSASAGVRDRAALVVWVAADPVTCLARGLARDGEAMADAWRAWQIHEANHFALDCTRVAADVVWNGLA